MAILHIGHIKAAPQKRFDGQIDLSDIGPNAKAEDRENFFLTRSLAAFLVSELAEIDDKIAAKAVVDGSKDNGIDTFYFDATERVCYLIQSKWIHNGKGSIEVIRKIRMGGPRRSAGAGLSGLYTTRLHPNSG